MSTYSTKLRRFEYTSILGWSYSRYDLFQQCKRKYYFQYYGKYDIENVVKINYLRNLTSIPLEVGNITHKLIRRLLKRLQKTADEINLEKFYDFAERETMEICRTKVFEDVYYGKTEAIDFRTEIFPKVAMALRNFLTSERLQWIFEEALATKDDWLIEFEHTDSYGECRVEDLKAYCKVDFMFPVGDELHIIDWKTGKEDYPKHRTQLIGYAGWANFHFDKDFSQIKTTIAYLLPEYSETSIPLNEYDIDEFRERVKLETDRMYAFCAEPELNIPLPKEEFEMTRSLNFCKFCNYRELCGRS